MHLRFDGAPDAFRGIAEKVFSGEIRVEVEPSRNGEVMRIPEPVIIEYRKPWQRVIVNRARDVNPFFHLYEALWMLAGRNDIASLTYYNSNMKSFTDDGVTQPGAYGYRWRNADRFGSGADGAWEEKIDQLTILIDHLKRNSGSRRAVLAMWNVNDDLLHLDDSVDVCCNLNVVLSVETGDCKACNGIGGDRAGVCRTCQGNPHDQPRYLNMTVFNRSNDFVLGALGANVVHFSFLQEYMALALGLDIGTYYQISTNLHIYSSTWNIDEWAREWKPANRRTMHDPMPIFEYRDDHRRTPLFEDRKVFDTEVSRFCEEHGGDSIPTSFALSGYYESHFLRTVAEPLMLAFHLHKLRRYDEAFQCVEAVNDDDWRLAAFHWIKRRKEGYERRNSIEVSSGSE